MGRFAKSLFGWRPDPSLLMVVGYLAYLILVGGRFLAMTSGADIGRSLARKADLETAGSDQHSR